MYNMIFLLWKLHFIFLGTSGALPRWGNETWILWQTTDWQRGSDWKTWRVREGPEPEGGHSYSWGSGTISEVMLKTLKFQFSLQWYRQGPKKVRSSGENSPSASRVGMSSSEIRVFRKFRTLLSIDSLKNKTVLFFKLSIDRSVRNFRENRISGNDIPTREAVGLYSPGPGNFRGTCPYHCRKKCIFRDFRMLFENCHKLTFDYSILVTGNLGEPSSSPKGTSLDLVDLTKYTSFDSPLSRRTQTEENSKDFYTMQEIVHCFRYSTIYLGHVCGSKQWNTIFRSPPHLSTFLVQKVPRGTFWSSGELFSQQFWNIFTPLKFGVYNENRDLGMGRPEGESQIRSKAPLGVLEFHV